MAAMRLVRIISMPAKPIFLQHLRKSPKINSVCCSLLNSTPKNLKCKNPDGFRSPSAKSRHNFSVEATSGVEAECRRRLGIGDAPVLHHSPLDPWMPPEMDEIKINFCGTLAEDHSDHPGDKTGTLVAVARNSAGDMLGLTMGPKRYNELGSREGAMDLQLYALKAAANLAKELEITGAHIGPVVYETSHITVAGCFDPDCEGSREEVLREAMPPDEEFEAVGRSCPIYHCGSGDALRVTVPDGSDLEAECRRRLGIGDAPVLHHLPPGPWMPPEMDEIKINFCGTLAEDHFDHRGDKTGTLVAVARNSAGDVLGVTTGPKRYNELVSRDGAVDLQLYALKAAANLAKELENTGTHIGPVVYETSHITVAGCFAPDEEFENVFPREEVLREIMPPDEEFEEVGRSCPIYCGSKDRLREMVPEGFFDFDRWDNDKALSGGCCVRTYLV